MKAWAERTIRAALGAGALFATVSASQADGLSAGMRTSVSDAGLVIESVAIDGPAERAGLQPGDRVTGFFHLPVDDMNAAFVERAVLAALDAGAHSLPLSVERTSDPVHLAPARDEQFDVFYAGRSDGVGLARIAFFGPSTANRLRTMIEQHPAEGWIVDLQGNRGGLVSSAIATADLFLAPGAAIAWEEADGIRTLHRAGQPLQFGGPVVLLVDAETASASELFSLALIEHKRAVAVGVPTYGKTRIDAVQPDGSTVAVGHYTGPSGLRPDRDSLFEVFPADKTFPIDASRGGTEAAQDTARRMMHDALGRK